MKQRTKLTQEEQHLPAMEQAAQHGAALEFSNVEELLRHDAAQTKVPPGIADRLRNEFAELPPPKMTWWERWFGGSGSWKTFFRRFFWSLPAGPRWLLLVYLLLFPVALAGRCMHAFELPGAVALSPALVWQGQVWRFLIYALLAANPIDWLISLFWLATLVSVLGRIWTTGGFLGYCLLGALAGALPVILLKPGLQMDFVGSSAIIFALLAAWAWFYGRERLILLGLGEISVHQAVLLLMCVNALILLFCRGWFITLAMGCGGLAGWLWLVVQSRLLMGRTPRQARSERIARLEL